MLLTTASGYQRIWFLVYWVDTVIIKKMEIRELEAELQWFWTQFKGIFKYNNEMDKEGIFMDMGVLCTFLFNVESWISKHR